MSNEKVCNIDVKRLGEKLYTYLANHFSAIKSAHPPPLANNFFAIRSFAKILALAQIICLGEGGWTKIINPQGIFFFHTFCTSGLDIPSSYIKNALQNEQKVRIRLSYIVYMDSLTRLLHQLYCHNACLLTFFNIGL